MSSVASAGRTERYRGVAALLFVAVAIVGVIGSLQVSGDRPPAEHIVPLLGALLGAFALSAVAFGLPRAEPWAEVGALALLYALVALGALGILNGLLHGSLYIPFAGLAALLVLRMRPRAGSAIPSLARQDRLLLAAVAGSYGLSAYIGLVAPTFARPGGSVFAVSADAIALQPSLDCSAARDPATGAPIEVHATLAWQWLQHEWWPGSFDGLVLEWHTLGGDFTAEASDVDPYLLSTSPDLGIEVGAGSSATTGGPGGKFWMGDASPSGANVERLVAGSGRAEGAGVVGAAIDVGVQQLRDDQITLVLAPLSGGRPQPPPHGTVQFWGHYVHLDRWTAVSDVANCDW